MTVGREEGERRRERGRREETDRGERERREEREKGGISGGPLSSTMSP